MPDLKNSLLKSSFTVLFALISFFAASYDCNAQAVYGASAPKSILPKSLVPVDKEQPEEPENSIETNSATQKTSIQIDELQAVDIDTIGLHRNINGFDETMWEASDRSFIYYLIENLPSSISSPAGRELILNLLTASANPPVDNDGKKEFLLQARIRKLVEMGYTSQAIELVKQIPSSDFTEEIAELYIDSLLMSEQEELACQEVALFIKSYEEPYWQKATVFCNITAGHKDKASFGLELLKEQNEKDRTFFDLANLMLGRKSLSLATLSNPSPLHIAMLKKTDKRYPPDIVFSKKPWVMPAIAKASSADIELRTAAAEKAVALNTLNPSFLHKLYMTTKFTDEEKEKPLSWAAKNRDVKGRALLFQTAQARTELSVRTEIIARALRYAKEDGVFISQAKTYAPLIKEMPLSSETAWFAGWAIKAMLCTGDYVQAEKWYRLARQNSGLNAEANAAMSVLWPLLRISEPNGRVFLTSDAFKKFRQVFKSMKVSESDINTDIADYLNIFSALGTMVREKDWLQVAKGQVNSSVKVPSASLWNLLDISSAKEKKAETVMLALIAAGDSFPSKIAPQVLAKAVKSLRLVGFDYYARALAIEYALSEMM